MKIYFLLRQKVVILLLLIISKPVFSQTHSWFSYERYNQSYIAEMYSSLIKVEIIKMNDLHPFYYKNNTTKRPFIETQIGFQLPILSFEKNTKNVKINSSLSAPISMLTLVDIFEHETASLINNDYRFGLKMSFLFTPNSSNNSFFKNYHITLVPVFHESTHIGDEFALHGYSKIPNFARINLSYEAWQVFAGINRLNNDKKKNLSLEIGYQRLMPYRTGYYKVDSFEVKGQNILPSKNRDLWIIRAEYSHPLKLKNKKSSELIASTEVRRETKFGYTLANPEKRVWSLNFYLGYRVPIKNTQKQLGIYYRHYRGLVPYGQLRDKDGFVLNGLSFIIN